MAEEGKKGRERELDKVNMEILGFIIFLVLLFYVTKKLDGFLTIDYQSYSIISRPSWYKHRRSGIC